MPCAKRSGAATCLTDTYAGGSAKLPQGSPPAAAINAMDAACPAAAERRTAVLTKAHCSLL